MHLDKGGREGGGPLAASLVKSVRTLVAIKGLKSLLSSSPGTTSAFQHQGSSSHHQMVILASLLDHSNTPDEREGSEHSTNSSAINYSNVLPPPAGCGSVNSVSIFKSDLVMKHSGNNNDDPHGDGDGKDVGNDGLDNLDDDNSKATPRRPVTTGGHGYQTREKAKLEGRDGR
jgi:hypothetical protein